MLNADSYLTQQRHHDPRRDNVPYFPAIGGGGGAGGKFCVYTITGSKVNGTPTTAKVSVYDPDDETTLIASDVDWIANLTMFDDQTDGDRGTCMYYSKDNKAYAVNAICVGGGGGGSPATPVEIGPTAPTDTTALWIDTSGI